MNKKFNVSLEQPVKIKNVLPAIPNPRLKFLGCSRKDVKAVGMNIF